MRILNAILTPVHTRTSGAIQAGLQMGLHMAEHADVDVVLMADRAHEERPAPRLRLMRVPSRPLADRLRGLPRAISTPLTSTEIPQLLEPGRYDLVHIHNPHPILALHQVIRAAHRARIPVVMSSHGFVEVCHWPEAYRFGPFKAALYRATILPAFRRAVLACDRIIMTSPPEETEITGLGVATSRISLVPNGVPDDAFEPPDPDAIRDACKRHDAGADLPRVVFLGNHTVNKGADVLLEALQRVEQPLQALFVGNDRADPDHGDALRASAASSRHPVVFTGMVSDADRNALLAAADLFVFPSRSDTMPISILEAMALGRPIVASRIGGVPYQLEGDCGWLAEPGDVASLAAAIGRALRDANERLRRGRLARDRARDLFTWRRAARNAFSVYRTVTTETRS